MDRTAFEERALEQIDTVYRMALQLTRHPEEASDLVQETYLKAIRACDGFQERGGGMRPWLLKILHNVFYSRLRRDRIRPVTVDGFRHDESNAIPPGDASPAWDLASLDWEQVDDRLKQAIDELKPEQRSILLLWGVEGMKYREIADVLDIPIGTVMSRLHRARSTLASELAELAEEKGLQKR